MAKGHEYFHIQGYKPKGPFWLVCEACNERVKNTKPARQEHELGDKHRSNTNTPTSSAVGKVRLSSTINATIKRIRVVPSLMAPGVLETALPPEYSHHTGAPKEQYSRGFATGDAPHEYGCNCLRCKVLFALFSAPWPKPNEEADYTFSNDEVEQVAAILDRPQTKESAEPAPLPFICCEYHKTGGSSSNSCGGDQYNIADDTTAGEALMAILGRVVGDPDLERWCAILAEELDHDPAKCPNFTALEKLSTDYEDTLNAAGFKNTTPALKEARLAISRHRARILAHQKSEARK